MIELIEQGLELKEASSSEVSREIQESADGLSQDVAELFSLIKSLSTKKLTSESKNELNYKLSQISSDVKCLRSILRGYRSRDDKVSMK